MHDPNLKYLIFGGSGKIGSTLSVTLGENKVDCPERSTVNLFKPSLIAEAVDLNGYGGIFYCAGISGRHILDVNSETSEAVNVESPTVIASIAAKNGTRFCYFSSDDVFDGTLSRDSLETDAVNPLNRYGREKIKAEQAILSVNPQAVIVRFPMIYGGVVKRERHVQFLDKLIAGALKGDGSWSLSKRCVTNPSCLDDLLPEVIRLTLDKNASGIFHVCNSNGMSLYEFGLEIKSHLKSSVQITGVDSTFSTPEYIKKGFAPMGSCRLKPYRSCTNALRVYLTRLKER